jgi:hypothetical protein
MERRLDDIITSFYRYYLLIYKVRRYFVALERLHRWRGSHESDVEAWSQAVVRRLSKGAQLNPDSQFSECQRRLIAHALFTVADGLGVKRELETAMFDGSVVGE